MADTKNIKVGERRRSSVVLSMSSSSSASRPPSKSYDAKGTMTRRSSHSVASTTASGYALSHTLSSSSQFIDPSKQIQPTTFIPQRIGNLEIRLLTAAEKAMSECLLDKDKTLTSYEKPEQYALPPISSALALRFKIDSQGSKDSEHLWIHLSSCRASPQAQVNKFIRDCYLRLIQMVNPAQAYLKLPPCFYLSKVEFSMGFTGGCGTYAWLAFDQSWVRRTIRSAMVTSIAGSLKAWRGRSECDDYCDYSCQCVRASITISYSTAVNGASPYADVKVTGDQVDSSKAFPTWLDAKGYNDFADWCGKAEASKPGAPPRLNNFQAKNIRLNYFGDVVKVDLVRTHAAPTSLPDPPQPVAAKKKGLFRSRKP